jgi:hypothetical protein
LPARVAEFAQDLAQAVVHFLKERGLVAQVGVRQRGEACDGRIHARIAGGN